VTGRLRVGNAGRVPWDLIARQLPLVIDDELKPFAAKAVLMAVFFEAIEAAGTFAARYAVASCNVRDDDCRRIVSG